MICDIKSLKCGLIEFEGGRKEYAIMKKGRILDDGDDDLYYILDKKKKNNVLVFKEGHFKHFYFMYANSTHRDILDIIFNAINSKNYKG